MAEGVYKIIEEVGTSPESWGKAATAAVNRAAKTLRDLRVAEIVQLDMQSFRRRGRSSSREVKALFQVRRLGRRSLGFFGSHQTSCMPRPAL
jgi:dodecin